MADGLRLDTSGPTLTATIDAGEGNLFTREMMDDLVQAIGDAGRSEDLRFVRLRATGETFCMGRAKGGSTPDELRGMARRIGTVNETLRTSPLTVLAEVNGSAAGFGVGMIGASDIAVAAETATFAFPEIKAGFAPAVVISWARFQLPQRLLYDMVSTGDAIDASTALGAGLVTEVVAADALSARVDERIARLEAVDPFALREMKRFLIFTRAMDPATAAQASVDTLVFSGLRVIGKF
jgi:enoyl-CoA hydratase/carnithine racemase